MACYVLNSGKNLRFVFISLVGEENIAEEGSTVALSNRLLTENAVVFVPNPYANVYGYYST